jgi:hypothetical protein
MAARIYSREALDTALAAYKCRFVADLGNGAHLWETGWKEPFTLYCDRDYYDEHQYALALAFVARSMPEGWKP